MQVPIFKPISTTDFQTDFHIQIEEVKQITTKIQTTITFNEYQFKRVKHIGSTSAVAYTDNTWVGETVCVIPMKLNVTDRLIEHCWNEDKQQYEITVETDVIYKKKVNKGSNIGRISLPTNLIGLDVLIIKAPVIHDLY